MPDAIKLCECGCGQPAPLSKKTHGSLGIRQGQPLRFVSQHHTRTAEVKAKISAANSGGNQHLWKGADASYGALHIYLNHHFPKTGVCEKCGKTAGRTDYALIHGHAYSRDRQDYRELCRWCHASYDHGGERHVNAKLTDEIVRDMRRRRASGETVASLAREYGVSDETARHAINGRTWRHIQDPAPN